MSPCRCIVLGLVTAATFGLAAGADAQSLAAVAKLEAERRGAAPQTGKVYTNGDLTPDPTAPPPAPPAVPAAESRAGSPTEGAPGETSAESPATDAAAQAPEGEPIQREVKGEDYWRGRAQRIRGRIEKYKAQIAALEARVNGMAEAEGTAALQERDLSRKALQKSRSDLAFLEEEWTNFEATAREKKIPDAWIR